ncbi:MAG: hypothetical protein IKB31_06820 [Bacteroidaceae bacterium]|nr:hypothetical protein [Bacteroidaceae bacterium]
MGNNDDDQFDTYAYIWRRLWWIGCIISAVLSIVWNAWTTIHTIIFLLGISIIYVLSIFIKKYNKRKPYPYKEMRNLVIETLKQIGCQAEIDKENESHVIFMYQGENFFISIENETMVTFYNTWWGSIDLNDPNIDNLKEAINLTNLGNLSKVVYSIYQEDNRLAVHTMYRAFLKKEIPALPDLFKAILANFFEAQKEVKGRFNQLNNDERIEERKERVKVKGFGT